MAVSTSVKVADVAISEFRFAIRIDSPSSSSSSSSSFPFIYQVDIRTLIYNELQ